MDDTNTNENGLTLAVSIENQLDYLTVGTATDPKEVTVDSDKKDGNGGVSWPSWKIGIAVGGSMLVIAGIVVAIILFTRR